MITNEEFIKAMIDQGKWKVESSRIKCNRDCYNCIFLHKMRSCYIIIQEILNEHKEWLL